MRTFFFSLLTLLAAVAASAEIPLESPDWHLDFEKQGIRIFTKTQPDSDFEAFKAEAILDTPITNIMAVMANPSSCVEWVHGCRESWGFEEQSFSKRFAYSVNDLPWPVKDRDYVLEINTHKDQDTGAIVMNMFAVDNKMPAKDEYVRVTAQETHYFFYELPDNKTKMVWLQHTEPAGSIPSWLVNALIVDIPYKSMRALEEVANSEKYSNAVINYDESGAIIGVNNTASQ
ncbi:START domain-containing protein [Hahella sp. CCB-MM4]|uniref:START domain-containing protein n=1 Tax=Hahella sp. (strain CCB-MM4) TaxID=1926491 RepID=UPI001FED7F28|nr:START domain-containing protein [Hahella sp. CCB-MM4]